MTDKERKLALYCLKASSDYHSEVCEECIKYPNCDHIGQDDVTETIIEALEQTRWIPVSERLPEEDGDYLVTTRWKGSYSGDVYTETHMAAYRVKSKEWDCADDVIAWMPSPSSYQGE